MGSPVSPIVANLYMEHFEREALHSASNPPRYWYRFVDDTWVIQQSIHKQGFLEHIDNIDPTIKCTVEGSQGNGGIPFLDALVTPEQTVPFHLQCTTNPPILTSTYSGIVTIIYLLSTVS